MCLWRSLRKKGTYQANKLDKIISTVQVLHPSEVSHRVENPLLSLGLLISVLAKNKVVLYSTWVEWICV